MPRKTEKEKKKKTQKSPKKTLKKGRGLFSVSKKISSEKKKTLREGEFFLSQTFEEYISLPLEDKNILGKGYRRRDSILRFFRKAKHFFRLLGRFVWRFSYRLGVASFIAFLVYSVSPGALSAPRSVTVSTKSEWNLGELTNVATDGQGANIDSVQLKPTGSWKAKVWAAPPDMISWGHTAEMAGNYLYVMRGYADNAFWRYDTVNNSWEELEDLPQPASYGSDMAYLSSQGKIYAMFGGYSQKFYSYDIASNEWAPCSDLLETIYTGASMETDGDSIYVIRGNTSVTFWKYSASEESPAWSSLDVVPGGATVNTGGSLVSGHDGYLYLVRGNGTLNFYRYNLSTRDWETTISSLPAGMTMSGEQKGAYWTNGTAKFLYFFRSNATTNFLRYQITCNDGTMGTCAGEKDTWTTVSATEAIPAAVNYASISYNENDGMLYAVRSNGSYDIWKYDPTQADGSRWVGPKQAQSASGTLRTLGTGSDFIWNGADYAYLVTGGGGTGYVQRYQISTNSWTDCTNLSVNSDVKGTYNSGNIYYLNGTTSVYYSNCSGAWAAMANTLPGAAGNGGSIVYNASDSRYYVLRGGGQANLYYSTGGAWSSAANVSLDDGGTTVTYYPNIGARMVSNGTNLYTMVGVGETAFLRYNTGSNTWSKLSPTPFAQYYGTDMTYNSANGKIYALAGYYKDETWEYSITDDSWRRLPDNQQYAFGRGPYNGASVEYVGNNSLLVTPGQSTSDVWNYAINSSNNFETSGTYVSQVIDLTQVDSWVSFSATYSEPSGTGIVYESMTSEDGVNWPSSWDEISEVSKIGGVFTGNIQSGSEERYMKVKATLTSDGVSTPTLKDFTISYNNSEIAPNNPEISGLSQQSGGVALVSGNEYAYSHPYFTWNVPNNNGSGIAGYWVCFGKSSECSDPETDGIFQTSAVYLVNEAMEYDSGESFGTYRLRVKSQDNNGLVASGDPSSFTYIYTGVSPYQTITKTSESDFNSGTTSTTSVISSGDGAVRLESNTGFWNQAKLSLQNLSVNTGAELAIGACQGSSDHCLYTFRGSSGTTTLIYYDIEADTWGTKATAVPAAIGAGGSLTEGPEGYLYAIRGGGNSEFWLYTIASDSWTSLDGVPAQVNYGAHLSYDGSRYVYIMPGNDDMLVKFDTCNGAGGGCSQGWTTLTNADFDNPNPTDGQRIYEGADGIYDGRNNLYVTQGWYYPYFSKYSIASDSSYGETANTWTPLPQAPAGFYNGGCMSFDSETQNIFALTGNGRMKFFKYSIGTEEWTELPDVPATISYGASMVVYDGYVYVQRGGGTTNFYRFNIEENSWELPNRGFFGPSTITGTNTSPYGTYFPYTTGTYITDDGNESLFAIRGGYDNTFGRYNVSDGTFQELARLPVGAYNGANIAYIDDKGTQGSVYYIPGSIPTARTSNNNYFFRYDVASNSWTEITGTRPNAQIGYGSSMVYDGSQYLYLTRGSNTGTWWRFDVETETWSSALPTATLTQQAGAKMVYVDNGSNDRIYALRGGGNTNFYVCDVTLLPGSNCWSSVANTPPLGINTGGSLMNGGDGYLYAVRGGNTNNYYRWPLSGGSWENTPTIPVSPVLVTGGGSGTNLAKRNWITAGYTASATNNVYADGLYSYVVGSSTSGTGFSKTGTYVSGVIDTGGVYKWSNISATYTLPENTYVEVETRTTDDETACEIGNNLCDNKSWSSWLEASNLKSDGNSRRMNINSSTGKFIQVRFSFTSSDRIYSPELSDFSINYYQDIVQPTGPQQVTAYSSSAKTLEITNPSGTSWFGHTAPYFEWPSVGESNGASDNAGGSGVAGYYVCFGTSSDCTDAYADGEFQTGNNFTAPTLDQAGSGNSYLLMVAAVDNAGLPSTSYTGFVYNLDLTAPTLPSSITVNPTGYSSASDFTWSWTSDAADAHSGLWGYRYRLGNEAADIWHDIPDPNTLSQTVTPYQANENNFYLQAVDNAGNVVTSAAKSFFWSGGAASPPQNLAVNPDDVNNTTNSFTFTWDIPESYAGSSSGLTYFYSVNYLPTPFNTVETTARSAGPGPFATQFGKNTMYVVAMSEGGSKTNPNDVDWDHPASVEFYAKTTAPGPPVNNQIFDTSDREAEEYSVAIKWSPPLSYDAGNFAGYTIYRSLDGANFVEVATTTGSAYVDTELESRLYYYYVRSRDKTNNLSVATSTLSITPTGRYTTAPTIVDEPAVSMESFAATITWSTNRVASSFVEYGTSSSFGKTNGQVDSVISHTVELTGLDAETKYFYRVKFIDPDGNIGTSETLIFTTNDPPIISDVEVTEIGLNSANVSWTTNMSGTCTLKYGEGGYSNSAEESAGGTSHIQKLSGLKSATIYSYQVECVDVDENSFNSDQYTFTTLEQPTVTDFVVQNKENVDIPTIEVIYKTTHPTTTLVKFKGSNEGSYHNYLISDLATEHTANIEGLDPAIEYEVIASGIDVNGVEALSQSATVTTLTDSRPPGITTNRAVGKVIGRGKDARANLYVKIETDESTTVKVLFAKGTVISNFEQSTSEDPLNTYHLITIPVDPGQVYSYVAETHDEAGNKTMSEAATVVIQDAKENATEIVVNTFGSKFGWITKLWQRN